MDIITMAHGSGGSETAELIDSIFSKHLSNPILDEKEDAAILPIEGQCVFSTDSFVIDPIVFKGGDIGKLAVCGTVNDLLCSGATPKFLSAGFILEEGLPLSVLEQIVISMRKAAAEAGVYIVAADTKVVEGKGGMYINTSGIGTLQGKSVIRASGGKPGDAIIVTGNLGDHHACILSHRLGIENGIVSDCSVLIPIVHALYSAGIQVHAMRDITRGGLATVLNELCDASGICCEIKENAIPVSGEVSALCGILGLDPLYMANEGKMLLFVSEEEKDLALSVLQQTDLGENACCIGSLIKMKNEDESSPAVMMRTKLSGLRMVEELTGEGLPRIC